MHRSKLLPITILALATLIGLPPASTAAQAATAAETKSITLGIAAETNQKEIEQHFREFVNYIARGLSSASPMMILKAFGKRV